MEILVTGMLLGGTYALIALGLTLQYGVARIMNLAYGESLVAAASAPSGCSPARDQPARRAARHRAGRLPAQLGDLHLSADAAGQARQEPRAAGGRLHPLHLRPAVRHAGLMLSASAASIAATPSLARPLRHPRHESTGNRLIAFVALRSSRAALVLPLRTRAGTARARRRGRSGRRPPGRHRRSAHLRLRLRAGRGALRRGRRADLDVSPSTLDAASSSP